jgi:hypothetical protein
MQRTTSTSDKAVVAAEDIDGSLVTHENNPYPPKVVVHKGFSYPKKDLDHFILSLLHDPLNSYDVKSLTQLLASPSVHKLELVTPPHGRDDKDKHNNRNLGFSLTLERDALATEAFIESFNPIVWTVLRLTNFSEKDTNDLMGAFSKIFESSFNWVAPGTNDNDVDENGADLGNEPTEKHNNQGTWNTELGSGGSIGLYKSGNALRGQDDSKTYVDILIVSKHDTVVNTFKNRVLEQKKQNPDMNVKDFHDAIHEAHIFKYLNHNALRILWSTLSASNEVLDILDRHINVKPGPEHVNKLVRRVDFDASNHHSFEEFDPIYSSINHPYPGKLELASVVYGIPTHNRDNLAQITFTSNIADKRFSIHMHGKNKVRFYPAMNILPNDSQEIALLLGAPHEHDAEDKTSPIGVPIFVTKSTENNIGQNLIRSLHPYLNNVNVLDCDLGTPMLVNYY